MTTHVLPHSQKLDGVAHRKHRKCYIWMAIVGVLVVVIVAARLYLNTWLLDYVNRVLNSVDGYQGSVASIDIDLYRGAYRLNELKVFKRTGKIPVPFIAADGVDLSIQWRALLLGRVVSDVDLESPILNFAKSQSGATQTGQGVDWTKPIKDLMPIDINLVTFRSGKLSYQDFSEEPKVNMYINDMHGEIRNLRNVEDANESLPSSVSVAGTSIGKGNLNMAGRMNILKPVPDMDLDIKLEKVHLPELSNYTKAYAAFDIEKGNLDLYSEIKVKNNQVSGYIKPIATDISLIDQRKTNPVKLVWESIMTVVIEVFTNQPRDQFATRIPLEGNLDNIKTDMWSAVGGIIRNAWVEAFRHGWDNEAAPKMNEKKKDTQPAPEPEAGGTSKPSGIMR